MSALVAPGWIGVAGAVFGWLLLTLAIIDYSSFHLPDELMISLVIAGLIQAIVLSDDLNERMLGFVFGYVSLWIVALGYEKARGREGLGEGDFKLFAAIGLWLGWRLLPAVVLVASLIGLGLALVRALRGQFVSGGDVVPFGTYLALAAYPAWLAMIEWTS